jgi:hypothetical protein
MYRQLYFANYNSVYIASFCRHTSLIILKSVIHGSTMEIGNIIASAATGVGLVNFSIFVHVLYLNMIAKLVFFPFQCLTKILLRFPKPSLNI